MCSFRTRHATNPSVTVSRNQKGFYAENTFFIFLFICLVTSAFSCFFDVLWIFSLSTCLLLYFTVILVFFKWHFDLPWPFFTSCLFTRSRSIAPLSLLFTQPDIFCKAYLLELQLFRPNFHFFGRLN